MFNAGCPSMASPFRIADKWGGLVVACLEGGPRRFSELQVPLRRVAPKVLTETLRALQRDGFVTRTEYEEKPPRVEYELTELGRTLLPAIAACREWGAENFDALLAARERYDEVA
ncbi:MAG: helix-turn-helix transcriptional regulator [Catenulispora sp.]|nr:helix-turn-helix transcriptional regulator [Catenulispora sp.]